jgi:hypothetical protein
MILRILVFLALIVSVAVFPVYVPVALFLVSVSVFKRPWEALFGGVFLDGFYFSPPAFFKLGLGFFTTSFVAAFLVTELVKRRVEGENIIAKVIIAASGGLVFLLFFIV